MVSLNILLNALYLEAQKAVRSPQKEALHEHASLEKEKTH